MTREKEKEVEKDEAKASDSQPPQPPSTPFPLSRPHLVPLHQLPRPSGAQLSHSPPRQSLRGAAGPCHKRSRPSGIQLSLLPPCQSLREAVGDGRHDLASALYIFIRDLNIQLAFPAS